MAISEKGKYLMNKKFPKILTGCFYKASKYKIKKRNSENYVFFVR